MKKLLVVLFVLVLSGCSSNLPVDFDELQEIDSDKNLLQDNKDIKFSLIDDTFEMNSDGILKGEQVFEGEEVFSGKLGYPSSFGAWYFDLDEASVSLAPKYEIYEDGDYYGLSISENSLDQYIPDGALESGCRYEFDVNAKVGDVSFLFSGYHIYSKVGEFELVSISDDFEEKCD